MSFTTTNVITEFMTVVKRHIVKRHKSYSKNAHRTPGEKLFCDQEKKYKWESVFEHGESTLGEALSRPQPLPKRPSQSHKGNTCPVLALIHRIQTEDRLVARRLQEPDHGDKRNSLHQIVSKHNLNSRWNCNSQHCFKARRTYQHGSCTNFKIWRITVLGTE